MQNRGAHLNSTKVKTFWEEGERISPEPMLDTEGRAATGGKYCQSDLFWV